MRLYASREYLAVNGAPSTRDQLHGHRLVSQSPATELPASIHQWILPFLKTGHCSHMTVSNYFGVLPAVLNGVGIGLLPDYVTNGFPQLVRVLPDEQSRDVPVYLAYPEELRNSKRVAAFREFVIQEIFAFRKSHKPGGGEARDGTTDCGGSTETS